jgi:hypothetical protein
MTRVLVKQVKFLVVVNLSVSKPSHIPFPRALGKNSEERSLILRVKRIEYNMLQNFAHLAFLLYRSIFNTLQDIKNYPNSCNTHLNPQRNFCSADTIGYLNPRCLKV